MLKNSLGIKQLEAIAELIPSPIYWSDANHLISGGNELAARTFGASSIDDILGKTPYDFHTHEFVAPLIQYNEDVMRHENTLVHEETIRHLKTGQLHHLTVSKSPLRCEEGKIIGVVGIFIEVTAQKNAEALRVENLKKSNVLKYLDSLASSFPIPVYWVDLNSKALGANQQTLAAIGLASIEKVLGKTPYDLYPPDLAERIVTHNEEIIRTGKMLSQEETIVSIIGEVKHYNAFKAPLRDEDGRIIGILGSSIDITGQKLAEKIRLENETQKVALQEQEKFQKVVDQVAHDIRSPLASMLMILQCSQDMPETERVALRTVTTRVNDIANNLLATYHQKEMNHTQAPICEEREAILVSPSILQMLTDKKFQYQNLSAIKFEHHSTQSGNFCWINVEPTAFQRMLSNIINNAVDAFDQQKGKVIIYLDADDDQVRITIKDNGKGMHPELVQNILHHIAFTEGKTDGHGIGLTQVRETLQNNEGQLAIESQIGVGTKMILSFPRAASRNWIADTIQLHDDDTVIILDDDGSIHMAWNTRFENILKESPGLIVKHFEIGQDTIDFINALTPDKKKKIFLLTDYELLKQNLNGLDIIKKTAVDRSVLVTSHYANKTVRHDAEKVGTKILPKQLAGDIPIHIINAFVHKQTSK